MGCKCENDKHLPDDPNEKLIKSNEKENKEVNR